MIKINLKNTKTSISRFGGPSVTDVGTDTGQETNLSTFVDQIKRLDLSNLETALLLKILVKLVVLCLLPFGLKVYEILNIQRLEAVKRQTEQELNDKKAAVSQIQIRIDSYGFLKKKEKEFDKKKELLSNLASSRLAIPRFLDEVQTIIPSSVWLKRIEVREEKDSKRQVSFSGESVNEEMINKFAEELKAVVEPNSMQFNTQDIKEGENAVKVGFDIRAELYN